MRRRAFLATGLTATIAGCLTDDDGPEQTGEDSADGNGSTDGATDDGPTVGSGGDGSADGATDDGSADGATDDSSADGTATTVSMGVAPDPSLTEDGLAPSPEDVEAPGVELEALETSPTRGVDVPLLPIEDAYDWYRRRDARFVDARSMRAYEASHIAGAVSSTAPSGHEEGDPTTDWPTDERIVTYCGCPHHLSTSRAAGLVEAGHEAVFAIDEGFGPWHDNGYPIGSAREEATFGQARTLSGSVDPSYAGQQVWVRHEPSGQREPGVIQSDGSYDVTIHFVDVDADARLTVETPAWTRTAPTSDLTDGSVR